MQKNTLSCSLCYCCVFSSFCEAESIVKRHRYLKRNEVLYSPGQKFQNLYAIQRGTFKAMEVESDGKELIRGFYFASETLGYEAIHADQYQFSAIALGEAFVCEIPYDRFLGLIESRPDLQKKGYALLSKQLSMGSYLASTAARQRLAAFLLDLSVRLQSHQPYQVFYLPMSRQDIGSYLRLTGETISRLLMAFQKNKWISIDQKKVMITHPEKWRRWQMAWHDKRKQVTPQEYYLRKIAEKSMIVDKAQLGLLAHLQSIYFDLLIEHKKRRRFYRRLRRSKAVQGIYIWGGVGIGKTMVMDCFYEALPFQEKKRTHFHAFMKEVHHSLSVYQGEVDPLGLVAKQLAKEAVVICLDELIVSDIADAMILCRLFHSLIKEGICLVLTSNTRPDNLYLKGLQRISFMPAIELIKNEMRILHVATVADYRLRHLQRAGVFFDASLDGVADEMEKCFQVLTEGLTVSSEPVFINERVMTIRKMAGDTIWFDFKSLCSKPRSQQDYLALADRFTTIFISNIPKLMSDEHDVVVLFIKMIDIFYDTKTRLIFSAETSPDELYVAGRMMADYQRTKSRLIEMQSDHYFQR